MIIKEIHDGKNKNNRGKVVPLLKFASQASIHALLIRLLIFILKLLIVRVFRFV